MSEKNPHLTPQSRNAWGLIQGIDYKTNEDGSINWRAMVKPEHANVGDKLQVDILGEMYEATVLEESPYDSENNLLRA